MKNTIKVFGIIAIVAIMGFSFTTCDEGDDKGDTTTSGRLTITGLNSYNGWKINSMGNVASNLILTAENNDDEWAEKTINGNSVTVYVWAKGTNSSNKKSYNGNDQNVVFNILMDNRKPNFMDYDSANGTVTVNFNNGVGTGAFVLVP